MSGQRSTPRVTGKENKNNNNTKKKKKKKAQRKEGRRKERNVRMMLPLVSMDVVSLA